MASIADSSALIAFLRRERGAEVVRRTLRTGRGICSVHVMNLCEVYYDFARASDTATAKRAIELLRNTGLVFRNDMDEAFWQAVGQFKADLRRVFLADCFCLALAQRLGGELLTADHHEFDPLVPQGICPIRFIR